MKEMTGREIVKRCIEFRDPPRIGMHFEVDPLHGRVWHETDFGNAGYGPAPNFPTADSDSRPPGADEWGIVKVTLNPNVLGEAKVHPLGEGWHLLDTYRFPDFANPIRYAGLSEKVAALHAQGKYVYGHIPELMLLPADMRGMENWLTDHLLEQESLGRPVRPYPGNSADDYRAVRPGGDGCSHYL